MKKKRPTKGEYKRRRIEKMVAENPHCHWCGQGVVIVVIKKGHKIPLNAATIDHLRSRYHPGRQEPNFGEQRWVLACRKCNHDRNRIEEAAIPIEELRRRSGYYSEENIARRRSSTVERGTHNSGVDGSTPSDANSIGSISR